MKAIYCQACGDIIAPYPEGMNPRSCCCSRHAVWWINPNLGTLRVFDRQRHVDPDVRVKENWSPKVWIIGMTNLWLQFPGERLTADDYQDIIEAHDPYYLFKTLRTVAIRIRPGGSSDTAYADALP